MQTFYSDAETEEFLTQWYWDAVRQGVALQASIFNTVRHLCRHVGRRPVGDWALCVIHPKLVVWAPEWVAPESRAEYAKAFPKELPYHPWGKPKSSKRV